MINLYPSKTVLSNGEGKSIADVISCPVKEQLNGCFDLTMQYPLKGENHESIALNAIICAEPRPRANQEPFFIYEIDTSIESVLTIKAHHLVYLLDGVFGTMDNVTGISAVISRLNTLAGSNYLFINDGIVDTATVIRTDGLASVWSMVGKCAAAFGAEMEYHYNFSTNKVEITFHKRRGIAKSTVIKTGVNIISLDRVQASKTYSAVRAWWWNGSDMNSIVSASVQTGVTTIDRELLLDCKQAFQTAPTTEKLQAVAQKYIDDNDLNDGVSDELTVNYVPLDITTEGTSSERLDLCDTATVDASLIGVTATAECIETIYNPLTGKYDSVKVGILQKTIVDTIAGISSSPAAVNSAWTPSTGATYGEAPSSSPLVSGSYVWKANVTLPAGTWVVTFGCAFSTNSTGFRKIVLSATQNSPTNYQRGANASVNAVSGEYTFMGTTAVIVLTTNTTLYLNCYQNSGSSLTAYPYIKAVKII